MTSAGDAVFGHRGVIGGRAVRRAAGGQQLGLLRAFWQEISKGVALLLAVTIDDVRRRRRELRG